MAKKPNFYAIDQSPLYCCPTKQKLAKALNLDFSELKALVKLGTRYNEWDEPKRSGGVRHIENPNPTLKRSQRRIARLLGRIAPPEDLYCPVRGRSYIDNAAVHCGQNVVSTIDIRNYFPSTSKQRVRRFWLHRMKCAVDVAEILTNLTCHNSHLPTGGPASAILSYYAHEDVWIEVAKIAERENCKISVYMDDLTISGEKVNDSTIWAIKEVFRKVSLGYHKEKSYSSGWAEVTGIVMRNNRLRLPNRQLHTMHSIRKQLKSNPEESTRAELVTRLRSYNENNKQVDKANNLLSASYP